MTVKDVTALLEEIAPLAHAEDFDNVGLLVGNNNQKVKGILVTLDTLETVIDEAVQKKCNLVVSFHPILFKGMKKITGETYVERVILKAIRNDIAIYSMHTALDNSPVGVNAKICEVLGVEKPKILIPKRNTIKKLTTYVPKKDAKTLREKLFEAGAGTIGNYSDCSFNVDGFGTFRAGENAKPKIGTKGVSHTEEETQLNITFDMAFEKNVLDTLFEHHPYEEVAYEVITLENKNKNLGMGMIGELKSPTTEIAFLNHVKEVMHAKGIRHSRFLNKPIKRVAVLGGSGAFAIGAALHARADVFIAADLKYHQFYEAEGRILIADIGHFETEQFTKNLLVDFLTKKIPNFAVTLSESITNPIKYF